LSSNFQISDIQNSKVAHLNRHLFETKPGKKSKYSSTKTQVEGIVFDSKKEARRYKELLILLKAGEIGLLQRQVPYELNEGGSHSLKYIADFVYINTSTGKTIVEDCKGYKTKEYIKKRRLMKNIHGIVIKET